jgi:hypothetical protein
MGVAAMSDHSSTEQSFREGTNAEALAAALEDGPNERDKAGLSVEEDKLLRSAAAKLREQDAEIKRLRRLLAESFCVVKCANEFAVKAYAEVSRG